MLGDLAFVKVNMTDNTEDNLVSSLGDSTRSNEGHSLKVAHTFETINDVESETSSIVESSGKKDHEASDNLEDCLEDLTESGSETNLEASETCKRISAALKVYSEPILRSVDLESLKEDEDETAFIDKIIKLREQTSKQQKEKSNGCYSQAIGGCGTDFDVVSILKSVEEKKPGPRESEEEDLYAKVLKNRQLRLTSSGRIMNVEKDGMQPWCKPRSNLPLNLDVTNNFGQQPSRIVEMQNVPGADRAVFIYCDICKRNVRTVISYEKGLFTYVAFGLCILCPFFILCAWIPFLFTDFMDVKHACPRCGTTIGIFNRV